MKVRYYYDMYNHEHGARFSDEMAKYNVEIIHPWEQEPLEVMIGLDPSSTTTGFTLGLTNQDAPFVFIEFIRLPDTPAYRFITYMMDYIVENIIQPNNITVTHIYSENIYMAKGTYGKNVNETLSMVKKAVEALPYDIKHGVPERHKKKPQLEVDNASAIRKVYLGKLNTNADRKTMKKIVTNFIVQKYGFASNLVLSEDLMESVGIYSAGFTKYVEPTLQSSLVGVVNFETIEWGHHINVNTYIEQQHDKLIPQLLAQTEGAIDRATEYGLKIFQYERGNSLEKNIRGLTSTSNAVMIAFLPPWDLESIPIYYKMRKTPGRNELLCIIAFRENIKEGV